MQFFRFITGAKPPLIQQSLDRLGDMLDTSQAMFEAATDCLLDNIPVRVDLAALDDEINENEQRIRRAVLEHISADPRAELSLSLLLVAIVQDAERCGDLAKSIAKASELADAPRMGPHVDALRPVRDRVRDTFPRVRQAFASGDTEVARTVMEEHDATKAEIAGFLRDLASSDDATVNSAVVLGVSSRMVGRTSSHLSNIISAVALPFDQVRNAPTWDTGA
jgi:phosphate uptake regulator